MGIPIQKFGLGSAVAQESAPAEDVSRVLDPL
jgi:hypothetical protein